MTMPSPKQSNRMLIVGLAGLFVLFLGSMIVFLMMNKDSIDTTEEDAALKVYTDQYSELGGENSFFVALRVAGDDNSREIYDKDFMEALRMLTDDIFFLPGIDRDAVLGLHMPYTRRDPVTNEGMPGTAVIAAGFKPTEEALAQLKHDVVRVGLPGELVAPDHRGVRVIAEWISKDPRSGAELKTREMAENLAELCLKYDSPDIAASAVMVVGDRYWIIDRTGVIDKVWVNSN